ncbi:MAG: hypothetical protein AB9856_07160 [Cellulosilyticaceae bacterium]
MEANKEQIIKEIMSIRRRVNLSKGSDIREIEVFEEQVQKSIKRIEQGRYLAKKFNQEELGQTLKAYESLRSR